MKIKFYLGHIFKRFRFILKVLKIRYFLTPSFFFRLDKNGKKIRKRIEEVSDIYQNEFYGISDVFRNSIGEVNWNNVYIEHGFYLYTLPDQYVWPVDKYICMNSSRAIKVSRESGRKALSVGPYINYVKKDIKFHPPGEYLLYIPIHDLENVIIDYDETSVIHSILKVAKNFRYKPVVCLYYKDYENKNIRELWRKRGFIVVTCGSRYDLDHLVKIKSLIGNSKLMLSNGFGTHYIYSLFMNIPTQIIEVKVNKKFDIKNKFLENFRSNLDDNISSASKVSINDLVNKCTQDFINDTQLAIEEKADIFGFSDIKNEQDIRKFLNEK